MQETTKRKLKIKQAYRTLKSLIHSTALGNPWKSWNTYSIGRLCVDIQKPKIIDEFLYLCTAATTWKYPHSPPKLRKCMYISKSCLNSVERNPSISKEAKTIRGWWTSRVQ